MKPIFNEKELRGFGELCRDMETKRIFELVEKHIKWKIRETHQIINNMKSKYRNRPSITRERTYLQYRKVIKKLEELKKELKQKIKLK